MSLTWSPDYAPVDGDFADVSLLLLGEGTNGSTTILDSSNNNLSVSVNGNAQISTAVSTPFGTGDGVLQLSLVNFPTNTNLKVNSSDLIFDADFTFETWYYTTQLATGFANTIIEHGADVIAGSTAFSTGFVVRADSTGTSWNISVAGTNLTTGTIVTNQWTHLAVSREGSIFKFFLDGILQGFGTNSNTVNPSQLNCNIGSRPDGDRWFSGYLSNLRITKGVARYTENFDVPTAPFPILSPSGRITIADDSLDADARQYIINVEEQDGEELEAGVRTAINDFVVGCKSDGIWNAIKASCLLCGARTLDGALVPLAGTAPTKFGTAANWNYDRKTGLQGDASSNYLNANRNDDADLQDNSHRSVYVSTAHTNPPVFGAYIGNAYTSPLRLSYIVSAYDSGSLGRLITLERSSDGLQQFNSQGAATGFVGTSRDSSSQSKARAVGSTVSFNVTSSPTVSGADNYVFARNVNGALNLPTNARLAFYSIGSNLDLAKLDTRISAFITAIGAAIP